LEATTRLATANVKAENFRDWAISSQAPQEWGEGSTTQVYSPERTMKPHERAMTTGYNGPAVYVIKNLVNGKVYVGSSIKVRKRRNTHWTSLSLGKHPNAHLQAAWDLYGEQAFEFSMIEQCAEDIRLQREQFWIDTYGASDPKKGYNISHSVRSLMPAPLRSALSKLKSAPALIEGRKSPKRRANIVKTWNDPGVRAAQSKRVKQRYADGYVQPFTDETKAKLREHNLLQWEDAEIKAKRLEGLEKGRETFWADPAKKAGRLEKLHEGRAKFWADPEKKTKVVGALAAGRDAAWADPDRKAKAVVNMTAARKATWADPIKKAEIIAKRAATRARNKARLAVVNDIV